MTSPQLDNDATGFGRQKRDRDVLEVKRHSVLRQTLRSTWDRDARRDEVAKRKNIRHPLGKHVCSLARGIDEVGCSHTFK